MWLNPLSGHFIRRLEMKGLIIGGLRLDTVRGDDCGSAPWDTFCHPSNPAASNNVGVFGQCERSRKSSDCDACLFTCEGECVYMKSEWLWVTVDFLLFEVHNKKWEREKSLETTLSFFPADKSTIAAGALRYRVSSPPIISSADMV